MPSLGIHTLEILSLFYNSCDYSRYLWAGRSTLYGARLRPDLYVLADHPKAIGQVDGRP